MILAMGDGIVVAIVGGGSSGGGLRGQWQK